MKILGLDFETMNDDARTTPITEIGARLVEWKSGPLYEPLESLSKLVYHPAYPPLTPFVSELTGITDEMLKRDGVPPRDAISLLLPLVEQADLIIAHNKRFDKTVFESVCTRMGIAFPAKEWLCTLAEFPWPDKYTCRKLGHLALEHKLPMDDRELHRAINDVELMLELIFTKYDFQHVLDYAREPWVYLRANIPAPWTDGGKGKEQAQQLGYGWERAKGTEEPLFAKTWVKRVKAKQVQHEEKVAPFRVSVLNLA